MLDSIRSTFIMLGECVKMSLSNILGNRVRSFLTVLGILIGVAAVIALITTVNGFSGSLSSSFSSMGAGTLTVTVSGSDLKNTNTKAAVIEFARKTCGIDMTSAVMIGDRAHDVEGARAHGIPCIGVTWGFGGREELRNAGADYIVDTAEELKALLLE